jgi:hypothetical protein
MALWRMEAPRGFFIFFCLAIAGTATGYDEK